MRYVIARQIILNPPEKNDENPLTSPLRSCPQAVWVSEFKGVPEVPEVPAETYR
jgi:hypothetical protein